MRERQVCQHQYRFLYCSSGCRQKRTEYNMGTSQCFCRCKNIKVISGYDWHAPYTLQILDKKWNYRGEGNANVVLSLPNERKIIRLRKSDARQAEIDSDAECEKVYLEVLFCRKVMIPMLGSCFIQSPLVSVIDDNEIQHLNLLLESVRPDFRKHKSLMFGHVTIYPDYTLLPSHLHSSEGFPIFCVEIKPKHGWVPIPDRRTMKCMFCMNQYLKIRNGTAKYRSSYCPLDLFSGNYTRMKKALKSLLAAPQNNLRIFQNGELVFGEEKFDSLEKVLREWLADYDKSLDVNRLVEIFCDLMLQALKRDLNSTVTKNGTIKFEETHLMNESLNFISEPYVNQLLKSEVTPAYKCTADVPCDWSAEMLPENCILDKILKVQKLDQCGTDYICKSFKEALQSENIDNYMYVKDFAKPGHLISPLHQYLISATAKDCSIMLTFQQILNYKKRPHDTIPSQHILCVSDNQNFVFNVGVSDIDPKPTSSILKHHKRNNDIFSTYVEQSGIYDL